MWEEGEKIGVDDFVSRFPSFSVKKRVLLQLVYPLSL